MANLQANTYIYQLTTRPLSILTLSLLLNATNVLAQTNQDREAISRLLPAPKELNLTGGTGAAYNTIPIENAVVGIEGAYDYTLAGYDNEAYQLAISNGQITIDAVSRLGFIRARQTLAQLAEAVGGNNPMLPACTVKDWPAFKLRGYMHDVGRSFISVDELKNEIKKFAQFKVNTFHFHLTENQAWRFESKKYPMLTADASMTRFAGKYYTQEQCKELDQLAYDNGMVIIPEIDMPGHSAAFERAMGHEMQTDEGKSELKDILGEVAECFPHSPYIHIGADEKDNIDVEFLKEMATYIRKTLGKKCVVWNRIRGIDITNDFADMTTNWASAGTMQEGRPNVDMRYNYTNHFDVFADLIGIYKSNIFYINQGNENVAGEISAAWNDRKTATQEDIIKQNNVWANVIASATRAWNGGGKQYIEKGGTTLPNSGAEFEDFKDFEDRFLWHKSHSLKNELIPYVKQTNVRWQITDAFPNGGDKAAQFPPETEGLQDCYIYHGQTYATGRATGAGIYLRHTWGTTVPTYYTSPQNNTTAYAWTYVYSPKAQTAGALIEFQNYGRSENDAAPENGQWDKKGSRIWLNDIEIMGPIWTNAGKTIDSEVDLGNENFTARPPVRVQLNKGWNKVFMKLPYVDVRDVRLNKWMFTFALTDAEGKNALDGLSYSPARCIDDAE